MDVFKDLSPLAFDNGLGSLNAIFGKGCEPILGEN
jgi:hypothetical protein